MKKPESAVSPGNALVAPVLCGLITTFILMLFGTIAIGSGKLNVDMIPYAALACVAVGGFLCGFFSAHNAPCNKLLWGAAAGAVLLLCLLLISFMLVGDPIKLSRVVLSTVATFVPSILGTLAGASVRRKKHKKK